MFIFPCVFHPCCFTSNLHACLGPAMLVDCVGDFQFFHFFSQLRMMRTRTWFKISSRSVVPKKSTHFHLEAWEQICAPICNESMH